MTSVFSTGPFASLKYYLEELLTACYCAVATKGSWRYERVAFAYYGLRRDQTVFDNRQHPNVCPVIRRTINTPGLMSKRIVPAFKVEPVILRLLASNELRDNRNHTAFPEAIIWNDRIVLTPLYHQAGNIWDTNPKFVMSVAKQLTEAVSFLHENRIAHLDIYRGNILFAIHYTYPHPRLLLTDFERSRHFKEDEVPVVDLWWRNGFMGSPPPEGTVGVNAYAFDIFSTGRTLAIFLENDPYINGWLPGIEWPSVLPLLVDRMMAKDPMLRPTAQEAAGLLSQIDEDKLLHHEGKAPNEIDWSKSLRECPIMAMENVSVPIVGPYGE